MNFSEQIVAPDFAMPGMHLVAASAGTGKTYSIQTLYLRLVMVEGLAVQQILVVTFTKAATKELKERLQKVLREALDFQNDATPNPDERIVEMAALAEAKMRGHEAPDAAIAAEIAPCLAELRQKGMTASILDEVDGVGPKRKKALIKHFKSFKRLREASLEEIVDAHVVPEAVARDVYAVLAQYNELRNDSDENATGDSDGR